jgi:hypothetical protein
VQRLALIDGMCNGFNASRLLTVVSFVESLVPDEPRLKLQGVADRGAAAAAPLDMRQLSECQDTASTGPRRLGVEAL